MQAFSLLPYRFAYLLQHGFGANGWVVGAEVFVLVDLLLEREVHLLEAVAQGGQRVPDVVRQLLVEHLLQVRSSQPIGHVTVSGMAARIKGEVMRQL